MFFVGQLLESLDLCEDDLVTELTSSRGTEAEFSGKDSRGARERTALNTKKRRMYSRRHGKDSENFGVRVLEWTEAETRESPVTE